MIQGHSLASVYDLTNKLSSLSLGRVWSENGFAQIYSIDNLQRNVSATSEVLV